MRGIGLVASLIALSSAAVLATEAAAPTNFEAWAARMRAFDRAYSLRPGRRDGPLRYQNISDEEVREIQAAAAEVVPKALVNISGVTTGCPCEDGPQCSDQVWIVAYRPDRSFGLLLSKVNKHWVIGPVQRWWLRYDSLRSRERNPASYAAYLEAERRLIEGFPACNAQTSIADIASTPWPLRRTGESLPHNVPVGFSRLTSERSVGNQEVESNAR